MAMIACLYIVASIAPQLLRSGILTALAAFLQVTKGPSFNLNSESVLVLTAAPTPQCQALTSLMALSTDVTSCQHIIAAGILVLGKVVHSWVLFFLFRCISFLR